MVTIPRAILHAQYRIARLPFSLFEFGVIARMDPESPARLSYERTAGAIDAFAGRVFGDEQAAAAGMARVHRAAERGEAVHLDEVAVQREKQADESVRQTRERVAEAHAHARGRARDRLDEAQESAQNRAEQASQAARQRTEAAKESVEKSGQRRTAQVDQAAERAQQQSRREEDAEEAAAQGQLQRASAKDEAATKAKASAERLETLSDAEKEKRRS